MIEPLALQDLLVNNLAGSMYIFMAIAVIAIAGMAAYFKMNAITYGMIIALFAVLMGAWANWFLFLIVLIGGLAIYFVIGKLLKQ